MEGLGWKNGFGECAIEYGGGRIEGGGGVDRGVERGDNSANS